MPDDVHGTIEQLNSIIRAWQLARMVSEGGIMIVLYQDAPSRHRLVAYMGIEPCPASIGLESVASARKLVKQAFSTAQELDDKEIEMARALFPDAADDVRAVWSVLPVPCNCENCQRRHDREEKAEGTVH